jgi:hypothetical protein
MSLFNRIPKVVEEKKIDGCPVIEPYSWEHRRTELIFFSILFAFVGFGLLFGMTTAFNQIHLPENISLIIGGVFAFIPVILLVWLFTSRSVRRGISDTLMLNKRLAIAEMFRKNRRRVIFDIKIPTGTQAVKFPGLKDEKGQLITYELSQKPDIDDDTNRTFYVFKEKANYNLNDFVQEELPELDVEESLKREKDYNMAYQQVRREFLGKQPINMMQLLVVIIALVASIIALIAQFWKH